MKRILALLIGVSFLLIPSYSEAAALQLRDIPIDADRPVSKKRPITNKVIELRGPEQQVSFAYEVKSDVTQSGQSLYLHFRHSDLLISPSSLTVQVDGKPMISVPLSGDKKETELTVPLKGAALKRGSHEVLVFFHGVIKEGICVEQGTSGNWLAIQVDSYLELSDQQGNDEKLSSYPSAFIGTGRYPAIILIPDQASLSTLDSALKVGAFLSEWTDEKYPVQVLRESSVTSLSSNMLVIGAIDEFSSGYVKHLLKQAKLPVKRDTLVLSYETVKDQGQTLEALFAIAKTPEALLERIAVLTEPVLFEQLVSRQFVLKTMPLFEVNPNNNVVKLSQFGMPNLTLTGAYRESPRFFHYAPFAIDQNQAAILELHLKRSALEGTEKTATEEVFNAPVSLTVLVNDVPHSINMEELTDAKEGLYTVQLPIEKSAIKDNRMISLQLQASGLMAKNPCVTTDHNRWIYIEESSFFTFPAAQSKVIAPSFAEFPSPFIDEQEQALVILPTIALDDNTLLYLYRKLYLNSYPMHWKLVAGDEITSDIVSKSHALFIGGPDVQPLLQDKQKKLNVTYTDDGPDVAALGFMQDTAQAISWVQPNVWSKANHTMLVVDWLTSKPKIDRQLLDFLQLTDEVANVAVTSANRKVYTNAAMTKNQIVVEEEDSSNPFSGASIGWFIGMFVLVALGVASVVYVLRKRR